MITVYLYSRSKGFISREAETTEVPWEDHKLINIPLDEEYLVLELPETGRVSVGDVTVYTKIRDFEEDMERLQEELAKSMLDQSVPLSERAEWARIWLEDVPGQLEVEKFSKSLEWLRR